MKVMKTIVLTLLAMVLTAGISFASPVLSTGDSVIHFHGFENILGRSIDSVTDPILDGDIVYGVLKSTDITNVNDVTVFQGTTQLTGFFVGVAQVADPLSGFLTFSSLSDANVSNSLYSIGQDGSVSWTNTGLGDIMGDVFTAEELSSNAVMKYFWEDLAEDGTTSADMSDITTYTDGTEWATMTLDWDEAYWYSMLAPDAGSGVFGTNYFGFQSLGSAPWGANLVNDPLEDLFDKDVALYGEAELSLNDSEYFDIDIADPAVVAPEPSTFMILGLGLLGLLGFRRKFQS